MRGVEVDAKGDVGLEDVAFYSNPVEKMDDLQLSQDVAERTDSLKVEGVARRAPLILLSGLLYVSCVKGIV